MSSVDADADLSTVDDPSSLSAVAFVASWPDMKEVMVRAATRRPNTYYAQHFTINRPNLPNVTGFRYIPLLPH